MDTSKKKVSMLRVAFSAQLSDEFVVERMAKKSKFFKHEMTTCRLAGLEQPIWGDFPYQGIHPTRNGCRERAVTVQVVPPTQHQTIL